MGIKKHLPLKGPVTVKRFGDNLEQAQFLDANGHQIAYMNGTGGLDDEDLELMALGMTKRIEGLTRCKHREIVGNVVKGCVMGNVGAQTCSHCGGVGWVPALEHHD